MRDIESWLPIEGYPDYQISDQGRVKSLKLGRERILKDGDVHGYRKVSLCSNGKVKQFRVHRLVAKAFIPNPEGLPEVNHQDEDKTNNWKENLEWCESQYNTEYSKAKHYTFIDPDGEIRQVFNLNQFCIKYNLNNGHMVQVSKGNLNQYKGWRRYDSINKTEGYGK